MHQALERFWYNGRDREVGESFEVEAQHVDVLTIAGKIAKPEPKQRGEYATRDMAPRARTQKSARH